MSQPDERSSNDHSSNDHSSDDLYDNSVTGARARGVGRLLGDAADDDEAMAVADEGDDEEDDASLSAEELAMHLTRAPSFDANDGYVTD